MLVYPPILITCVLPKHGMATSFDGEVNALIKKYGFVTQREVHRIGEKYGYRPIDIAGRMARLANRNETRRIRLFLSTENPQDPNMRQAWAHLIETS